MSTCLAEESGPVPENWLEISFAMEKVHHLMIQKRNVKIMLVTTLAATNILLGLTIAMLLTPPLI